jgi:hypothetical protein
VCDDGIHGEVLQYYTEVIASDPEEGGPPPLLTQAQIEATFYAPIPEPLTVGLFGLGLIGVAATQRRRRIA